MKFATKISIGLFFICGLTALYYGDEYITKRKEAQKIEMSVALYFKPDDIKSFYFKNKNESFAFERKDKDEAWKSIAQPKMNVDQGIVNRLLTSLAEISIQQSISGSASDYGLEKPELTIELKEQNNKIHSLSVGNSIAIGEKTSGILNSLSAYAKSAEKKSLLVVDSSFRQNFENKTLKDFYSKQISHLNGLDISEISIDQINKKTILKKIKNKWELTTSQIKQTDASYIGSYIQMYQMLMAEKIYTPQEVKSLDASKFNLKSQAAIVTFKDSNDKVIQTFSLSITRDGIFTPLEDGSIGQLPLDSWPELVPDQVKFQNRTILLDVKMDNVIEIKLTNSYSINKKDGKWPLAASDFITHWKTLAAQDLVTSATENDLKNYGITNPLKTFSFVFKESDQQAPIEIIIGNRVPNNEKNVYVKRSDSSVVYIVNADWLSELAKLEPAP